MEWWEDYSIPKEENNKEDSIDWKQKACYHAWKPTVLIISTVYDCTKCGVKKEQYEDWEKKKV